MDTVFERIIAELVARLERISTANGFRFDQAGIVRPNRRGTNASPTPRTYQVEWSDAQRNEDYDLPGNPPAIGWSQEIRIVCIGEHADTSTAGRHVDADMMVAEAVRAVTNPPASPHRWFTFGELALDAEVGDVDLVSSPQARLSAAYFPVTVHFRVDENDPYQARA